MAIKKSSFAILLPPKQTKSDSSTCRR